MFVPPGVKEKLSLENGNKTTGKREQPSFMHAGDTIK